MVYAEGILFETNDTNYIFFIFNRKYVILFDPFGSFKDDTVLLFLYN